MLNAFEYKGSIPGSKSLLNRSLIIQNYFPELTIFGESSCDDVQYMKTALVEFSKQEPIHCGEAGTTFRFMALRASRMSGKWTLSGSQRLLERPQEELLNILHQFGVLALIENNTLLIDSTGWRMPNGALKINRDKSSQFASAVLLNAWDLPFDLEIGFIGPSVSNSYWDMTVQLVRDLGMNLILENNKVIIPQLQKITQFEIQIEPDYSSLFAVAVAAALCGKIQIQPVPEKSLQPDAYALHLLKKMGIPVELNSSMLTVEHVEKIEPLNVDLSDCPDLFPVLGVLCSFANGISRLSGAPHLAHKESNRIAKTWELLQFAGVDCDLKEDGLVIHGKGRNLKPTQFRFNPDHDHRMAMAAGILKRVGFNIQLENPEVVSKSFPEFWSVIGLTI